MAAEAGRLSDDYGTDATAALVVLALAVVVALGLLVWAQSYVTRISRRVLDTADGGSDGGAGGVSAWAVIGMLGSRARRLARHASDSVEVLSATRVLLARARSGRKPGAREPRERRDRPGRLRSRDGGFSRRTMGR